MFSPALLAGKRILITGGGTGLGKSMGRRFLELGAELAICGRRGEVLEATAEEHRAATGGKVTTRVCDVRDAEAVEAMVETLAAERTLDALVNNAAGNFICRSEELSPRAVDAVVGIVLRARPTGRSPAGAVGWRRSGRAPSSASSPPTPGPARPMSCPQRWPRPACWR
jgi:NAD(P)-dependent dehydrogenase (short-subunit alcohol dehydrogenase family)